mmetsp:Transcript_27643/g.70420  ORF Transcript_27643/g.70420 Transcript_27643/m.70420 type:complete len:518 (-) Transcript_27643:1045-2598(-)
MSGEGEGRVVGKNAWSPGLADCPFAALFIANVAFVVIFFFIWVGGGCQGWPDGSDTDAAIEVGTTLAGVSNETMNDITSASVTSGAYALLFTLAWVFIYLGIMKVAALGLIITLNLLVAAILFAFGGALLYQGMDCKNWDEKCSTDQQTWAYVGGIILLACGVLHLLWLCCIRDRIVFTAKMLSAVSGVLAICPGTILISFIFACITVAWWTLWGGAFVQSTIYLAGSSHASVPYGSWVGMLFGMLISAWWGHKTFLNIAHMTSCHVIASWYFDPDSAEGGIPCCKPVTLTGLKRACTNYLGSIAFGSLIVAILEAIYYTVKLVMEKALGGQNFLIKMIACCFLCCLGCLKRCIEWLTEWAYCYIAVYGCGFIEAGGKVFKMLADSGMGAVAQSTLVEPVLMLGRICGAAIGVGAGFLTLQHATIEDGYKWSQPLVGAIVGWVVASVALSCVDAGNKCIYVCYVDAPELMNERDPDVKNALDGHPQCKMAEYKSGAAPTAVKQASADPSNVDVAIRP